RCAKYTWSNRLEGRSTCALARACLCCRFFFHMRGPRNGPRTPPTADNRPADNRPADRRPVLTCMLSDLLEPAAKRVLALVPVLIGVSLLVFGLTAVGLGDPVRSMLGQRADPELVEQIRRDYALDRPVHERYLTWMGRLLRGDLGTSYHQQRPVTEIIAERLPATVHLAVAATALSVVLGMTAGVIAALRPGRLLDQVLMSAAVLGISTPVFWLGMMLSLLFAVWLGWLPVSGYGDGAWPNLVLPALTLGAVHTGTIARMARSSLLEVVRQDYIQRARQGPGRMAGDGQARPPQRPDPRRHRDRHRARRPAGGRGAHRDRVRLARHRTHAGGRGGPAGPAGGDGRGARLRGHLRDGQHGRRPRLPGHRSADPAWPLAPAPSRACGRSGSRARVADGAAA